MENPSNPFEQQAIFSSILTKALAGQYAMVIDARSDREYAEDHVPGAVNLAVVDNNQYAEVGTMHRDDKHGAYLIGVSYALKNMSRAGSKRVNMPHWSCSSSSRATSGLTATTKRTPSGA